MGRIVVRQFFLFIFLLWLFTTVIFFLFHILPGGPFDLEQNFSAEVLLKLQHHWGLDRTLPEQYLTYLRNVFSGELGLSISNPDQNVLSVLQNGFRNTFVLNTLAIIFIFVGAIFFSYLVVKDKESKVSRATEQLLIFMSSFPSYFLAPFLVYFFCFRWDMLPMAYLESAKSYILPVIALSLRPMAQMGRVQSKNWSESLSHPSIRTAFAKGLSREHIIWKHGFRASCSGLFSWLSPLVVGLYSGSLIIESLFSVPGLGSSFVQSLSERDYPVMMGCTIFFGGSLIFISSVAELIQIHLDPRLQALQERQQV